MDSQPQGDDPSTNPIQHPPTPSPVNPAKEKAEVTDQTANIATHQQEPTMEIGKREFRLFEIASLGIQVILVFIGIGALCIYGGQLAVMRGTLDEMKRSGGQSTDQVWRAIDNINWLARSMDLSQKRIQQATEASDQRSREALNASIAIFHNEQRAWIIVPSKYNLTDFVVDGPITYLMGFVNIGKTPAASVKAIVRAEVITTGNDPTFSYEHGTSNSFEVGQLIPNDQQSPKQLQARADHMPIILSAERLQRIRSGVDYVAIYGEVTYRDIAGYHWMRFCSSVYSGPQEKGQAPQKCGRYNSSGDGRTPPNFQ